jgi:hypothetical protein
MRQGRGDEDYSSLFRQYFPSGSPLGAQTNGDDDQPRLAGIDEGKTPESEPENVPVAVETTAEVPSEAKAMGEVVSAPAVAEIPPEAKVEAPAEVAGHAEPAIATSPAPAAAEPLAEPPAPAISEPKPKGEPVLSFPAPVQEGEGEEPRGLWGGFWRRRTDD